MLAADWTDDTDQGGRGRVAIASLKLTAAGNEVVFVNAGEPVARMTPEAKPEPLLQQPRIPGLHPGAVVFLSEDCDEPLPDEFWLGGDP